MIKFLLDTNVVSEPIKSAPNKGVMQRIQKHQQEMATASIVWHELRFGCHRLPASHKRKLIEAYLMDVVAPSLEILPYDTTAADWHAAERARLTASGKPPAFADGQIAAIAKVNKLILVTRNVLDFKSFSGLKIQNWYK